MKNKTLPFVYGAAFAVIFYNPVVLCDHGSLKIGFNTIKNIFRLRKACTHFLSGVSYWHGIFHMSISCRGKKKIKNLVGGLIPFETQQMIKKHS